MPSNAVPSDSESAKSPFSVGGILSELGKMMSGHGGEAVKDIAQELDLTENRPKAPSAARAPKKVVQAPSSPGSLGNLGKGSFNVLFGEKDAGEPGAPTSQLAREYQGPSDLPGQYGQVPSDRSRYPVDQDAFAAYIAEARKPLDPKYLQEGLTPVPGEREMPTSPWLARQIQPWQNIPLDERQMVGRGNARAQGITNAITGVTNFVGNVVKGEQQRKQDRTAVTIQKMIELQRGIDQANESLKYAPPDKKAQLQKYIKDNTDHMNLLLADKATRKDIERGMNVSFTDPSKNKTPSHDAYRKGVAQAQQNDPDFAKQFQNQMPQKLKQDPMGAINMQLAIAQKQSDQKTLSTLLPKLASERDMMKRMMVQQYMISDRQATHDMLTAQKWAATIRANKDTQIARHADRMDEIGYAMAWIQGREKDILTAKNYDPTTVLKLEDEWLHIAADQDAKFRQDMSYAQEDLQRANQAVVSAQVKGATPDQLKPLQDDVTRARNQIDLVYKEMQQWEGTRERKNKQIQDIKDRSVEMQQRDQRNQQNQQQRQNDPNIPESLGSGRTGGPSASNRTNTESNTYSFVGNLIGAGLIPESAAIATESEEISGTDLPAGFSSSFLDPSITNYYDPSTAEDPGAVSSGEGSTEDIPLSALDTPD
ncbi:MAG TPA: hypothetical protein VII99_08790 [Bacteroidia bacterium]